MLSEKKNCSSPKLYDYRGDLSKVWFVQYRTKEGKYIKIQKGINKYPTAKARRQAAKRVIQEIIDREKARFYHKPRKKAFDYIELRKPSCAKKTYESNKSKVSVFFDWLGFRDITKTSIEGFFREYLMKRKAKTYNGYKVVLKQILRTALDLDTDYLFADVEKRKNKANTAVYFTDSQIKLLSNHMQEHDHELWLAVQFVYYCYIRPREELRYLKVSDIQIEEGQIIVHGNVSKNGKTRYCQIPDGFAKVLKEELKDRLPNEYVIHAKDDPYKIIGYNTLGIRHVKILKKLNFDTTRYKMYGWKNTGMVQAIKAKYPLKWIQIQAGHHSLEQTDQYLKNMGIFTMEVDLSSFPIL